MHQQHLDFLTKYHDTSKKQRPLLLNEYLKSLDSKDFNDFMDNYDIGLVDINLVQEKARA